MYLQDGLAADHIGIIYDNAAIEAAGAQKRGIQYIASIRGGHHDYAFVVRKAVHFHQQLIERLFAFIVTAAQTCAALTANRIDFIDEDDRGSVLFGFGEQIAHAARAHADEHFNEIRT